MSDMSQQIRDKLRRSVTSEFVQMEDDFDDTRAHRDKVISKIMTTVDELKLVDDQGVLREDAGDGIRLLGTALKALSDKESANVKAIGLKLKQQELSQQSAQMAKDRIAIVLKATAPGAIVDVIPHEQLAEELSIMFDGEIQDFELKSSSRDLSD